MLCYVFRDDGQLLGYFTMEAAAETDAFLYTEVEDCRTQKRELFRIMTPMVEFETNNALNLSFLAQNPVTLTQNPIL